MLNLAPHVSWYLQPPPPTLPMYRSQCWCITGTSPTNKSVVCIPPVYVIGVAKCGTVDLVKGIWRHPLVERANTMEQIRFTGNLQYVKKTMSKDSKSISIWEIYACRGRLCPPEARTAHKVFLKRQMHHDAKHAKCRARKCFWHSGPRLNIKTVLSTYGDFHVKDKTVVRTSYL